MRLRSSIIPTVAMAVIFLLAPQVPVTNTVASAQTDEDVTVGTFYNDLSIFGDWIAYQGTYVFVPRNVDAQWRPYTRGQWVYFDAYGWLWVSQEPFGWATYHYGRWGHSNDIGWYWAPGRQWAPAWVSWRRSGNYVAWRPIPPGSGRAMSAAELAAADIPARDWTIVPARDFLDSDLARRVILDNQERLILLRATRPLGRATLHHDVVVNDALDVGFIESKTGRKIVPAVAAETDNPRKVGQASDGKIIVFPHDVKSAGTAKPGRIGRLEEIEKEHAGNKPVGEAQPLPKMSRPQPPAIRQATKPEVIAPPRRIPLSPPRMTIQPPSRQTLEPSQAQSSLSRMKEQTAPRGMQMGTPQFHSPYVPERLPGKL